MASSRGDIFLACLAAEHLDAERGVSDDGDPASSLSDIILDSSTLRLLNSAEHASHAVVHSQR
jgi:hypothetical protein